MSKWIRHPRDFYAGLMYGLTGIAVVVIARSYTMGTSMRMGPGYFPTLLAWLLIVIGAISILRSLARDGERIEAFAWKPIALVLGSTVLFGVLVRGAGLVPALMALILVSAWASPNFKLKTTLLLATGTTLLSGLVFVKGLGLPLPLLGTWFQM